MSVTTAAASRVLEALGDAFRRHAGPGLDPLVDGLAAPLDDTDSRVTPTARGWAQVFDLDTTPDPAWLGRAIGTKVPVGLPVEEARALVRGRAYWKRGTPAAIVAAVQQLLTGTKHVTLLERDGSPWRLTVRVYETEVPAGVTVEQIAAAAATQKPVGIVVTVEIATAATYAHFAAVHGPTYQDVADDFPTYIDAHWHVPEEGTIG